MKGLVETSPQATPSSAFGSLSERMVGNPQVIQSGSGRSLPGGQLPSSDWLVTAGAFIVTYLDYRCKLTLDECIALFPTVEIFQAA
jgi:hypothetical protein